MKFNRLLTVLFGGVLAMLGTTSNAEALLASVKSTGMAGAATAYPQDTLSAAYNPAGFVEVGNRLDLGIAWAHYWGRTKIHGNTAPPFLGQINGTFNAYKTPNFYSPEFGVSKVFGCDCQFAYGWVLYNRNQSKTTYNVNFPLLGRTHLGLEYVHEQFGPVFAWKVNDCLNLGMSFNINGQRLKVNGLQNFANPRGSIEPNRVTNRGYSYSFGYGVTLGAQLHINPCLTLGFAFTPEVHMRRFKKYSGFLAKRGRFNLPEIWIAGIAWRFLPCATVAFDIQHDVWRRIPSIHHTLLHDGRLEQLGSKHGPGFGWRSRTYFRLGLDYALNDCWIVRAGWRFAPTPIRRTQTVVNSLTMEPLVEHVFTMGATWMYNSCQEASAFFAYGFEKKLKGKHSIPTGIPFFGGNADLQQNLFVFGLAWGWNW